MAAARIVLPASRAARPLDRSQLLADEASTWSFAVGAAIVILAVWAGALAPGRTKASARVPPSDAPPEGVPAPATPR